MGRKKFKNASDNAISTGKAAKPWTAAFPAPNQRTGRSGLDEKAGNIRGDFVEVEIGSYDDKPTSSEDADLRLHLLSECVVRPNEINLEGIFDLLPNIAWTSAGPVLPARVDELRTAITTEHHHLTVTSIDKFQRMTDYVIPEGVRIGDADRVRLGAHLSPGTTVMHEGFVNFNTGIGISLGDECILEAGLYVTAGTKVKMPDGQIVSARDLSGRSGRLYRHI